MRKESKVLIFCFIASLCFTSCRKDDTSDNGYAPADASRAKYLFDAAKDEVDQHLNLQSSLNGLKDGPSPRGGCATVSIAPLGNVFPKVVTIVFPQGCKTFAGADIAGTMVINVSGRVREAGSTATFTLTNFNYKGYLLSADYVVTFTGPNSHKTEIMNGKITTPDNKTITYSAINTGNQIEGTATTFKTNPSTFLQDDVYEITTMSEGVNSKGNNFMLNTDSALRYAVACQWITEGKIMITEEARPKITASLDYGDKSCDNKAVLTINGIDSNITLP